MTSSSFGGVVLSLSFLLAACGGGVEATSSGEGGEGGDGGAGGPGGAGGAVSTATSSGGGGSASGGAGGGGGAGGEGGAGGATSTGGSGSGDCPLLAVLTLTDPSVNDDGGDGTWSPGEGALVTVTMTNPTNTDVQYPGITWSSNEPLVSTGSPYNAFFVLFADTSMPIDVGFAADPATPKGTKAQLTGRLTDIQGNVCDDLPAVTIDVIIE